MRRELWRSIGGVIADFVRNLLGVIVEIDLFSASVGASGPHQDLNEAVVSDFDQTGLLLDTPKRTDDVRAHRSGHRELAAQRPLPVLRDLDAIQVIGDAPDIVDEQALVVTQSVPVRWELLWRWLEPEAATRAALAFTFSSTETQDEALLL